MSCSKSHPINSNKQSEQSSCKAQSFCFTSTGEEIQSNLSNFKVFSAAPFNSFSCPFTQATHLFAWVREAAALNQRCVAPKPVSPLTNESAPFGKPFHSKKLSNEASPVGHPGRDWTCSGETRFSPKDFFNSRKLTKPSFFKARAPTSFARARRRCLRCSLCQAPPRWISFESWRA